MIQPIKFICRYSEVVDTVIIAVYIRQFNSQDEFKEYFALWDTGSNYTTVSNKLKNECNLNKEGMISYGSNLEKTCDSYKIDIKLFSKDTIILPEILVVERMPEHTPNKMLNDKIAEIDSIIGMNIISLSDSLITNYNNQTILKVRIPSQGTIDF